MSSCPELPAPKPQIPISKSDGHYTLGETWTKPIQSSDVKNSGSYHSSSEYSEYTTTYSASAIGAESDTYATTSDTLGMIETPWSTESWQSRLTHITPPHTSSASTSSAFESASIESEISVALTTFTIEPQSSISSGVKSSPSLLTLSNETWKWTCLNSVSTIIRNKSSMEPAKAHNVDSLETISSWTVQSFTSTGLVDSESKVRVKYPWSPRTVRSDSTGVTAYPSSVSFELQSTHMTATTQSAITSQTDFNRLIAVNYLVLDTMHRIFKNP